MAQDTIDTNLGISRRTLIKRGAIVGGTLLWAAPAIETISKASAAGSQSCSCNDLFLTTKCSHGHCQEYFHYCTETPSSCACSCRCASGGGSFGSCTCTSTGANANPQYSSCTPTTKCGGSGQPPCPTH